MANFHLHAAEQWAAAHMQGCLEDLEDKAGAHSIRGRPRLGERGGETAALRPKYAVRAMKAWTRKRGAQHPWSR